MRSVHDQIAKLREWGGDDVVAIGSDLDGFIKPTMAGIETVADLATLEEPLRAAYPDADAILSGNALRVARWALG
jgi:microsomal dipeptidase-like Zn-dependent dipeptidase